jgi:murein DD-endopeptidase MepM/ murein hydrolase activator NlpD
MTHIRRTISISTVLVFALVIAATPSLATAVRYVPQELAVPLAGPKMPVISEGWKYSQEEQDIHGFVNHSAVDFEAKRGAPIYAAADGYAISSAHLFNLVHRYQGKAPIGFGLGNFVQVWHPSLGVYTSYSHLQKVSSTIPYFAPTCEFSNCDPKDIYNPPSFSEQKGVFVKQGQLLGWIGDSGLGWGYLEQPQNRPDPIKFPSWDRTHLHFEVYDRDPEKFLKQNRYDPFGWYDGDLSHYTSETLGLNPLWKLNARGLPVFAH